MLTCEHLTVAYDGKTVLRDVSFKINDGEYITVVGENGSGKTTLFKAILKEIMPVSGEIYTSENTPIGYLPQNISINQSFPAQVFEVVMSGFVGTLGTRPFFNSSHKRTAEDNLHRLGILELKNNFFNELSGGQKQRVLLARALCATKSILMLDEPVASLDSKASLEFYELIKKLNREDGITVLMISHDPVALNDADRVLVVSSHSAILKSKEEYFDDKK